MAFNIDIASDSFKQFVIEDLKLEDYNRGYEELYSFFNLLGRVFGFIASDVREKIDILNDYIKPDNATYKHYVTTESMMLYEIQINKETGAALHGSRTLLRLHRALKFVMLFLDRLRNVGDHDGVATIATSSYNESLAHFHPWYIRNAAKLAMYTLPSRQDFFAIVYPGYKDSDEPVMKEKLLDAVTALKDAYMKVEALYTKYDLHGLP